MAEQSPQIAQYSIPQLSFKTRPQLDSRSFRERGSKNAEIRFMKLHSKIQSLNEFEGKLRTDAIFEYSYIDSTLQSAYLAQEKADLRLSGRYGKDIMDLYAKVTDQFKETQSALERELIVADRAGFSGLKDRIGTYPFLNIPSEKKIGTKERQYEGEMANELFGVASHTPPSKCIKRMPEVVERGINCVEDKLLGEAGGDRSTEEGQREASQDNDQKGYEPNNGTVRSKEIHSNLNSEIYDGVYNNSVPNKIIERLGEDSKKLKKHGKGETQERTEKKFDDISTQTTMRQMRLQELQTDFGLLTRRYSSPISTPLQSFGENVELLNMSQAHHDIEQVDLGLQSLEPLIEKTGILEKYISKIRELCGELVGTRSLKRTLQLEMDLEHRWIHYLKSINPQKLQGNSITYPNKYFPGRNISKEKIYNRLEKGEFRVLVLAPAPESCYPLFCKLETWPMVNAISTQRQYAALSYVWGQEIYNGRIYLLPPDYDLSNPYEWNSAMENVTPTPLRNNLFRGLLRLRQHGPNSQPVALWVDFICIDQGNMNEKADQIPRMVDIYHNARNVCIWLGENDDEGRSDEAMEFISAITDFAVLDNFANDKKQAKKWFALGELMRDRWFSRRWVVQEIALAKEATVYCGGSIVRWHDFADAASLLVSNQETIKSLFDFSEWREGRNTLGDVDSFGASILLEATNNLFRRKPGGGIKKPIKTIESLVTSLRTFDTSDQRDLIYSLMSIAKDTSYGVWNHSSDDPEKTQFKLKVDYNQSQLAVYKAFTQFCVLSSKSLDIICRPWAMPLQKDVIMPSWIPLLSNSEFGVPEEVYSGRKNGEVLVGPVGSPNYETSGKTKFCGRFEPYEIPSQTSHTDIESDNSNPSSRDENNILIARGFRLAKIGKISPRNVGGVITHESLKMGGWKGFNRDTTSVPDSIWRTLIADRDQDGCMPPSWYQRACLRCLEIASMFNNGDLNIGELLQGHSDMLRKYLTRVRNVTWNRRFFTATIPNLKLGHGSQETSGEDSSEEQEDDGDDPTSLFGLCPPKTKVGDLICILYGCTIPVILREGQDGYVELVGEVYVHGKMDGEAMEEFQEDDAWKEEDFRIR